MVGLRTWEGEKFERFFALVQKEALKQNCVFFLDSGEGHLFENDTMEYSDLDGWLIPIEKAKEFEKEYLKGGDPEGWYDYFYNMEWEDEENPKISFEHVIFYD